MRIGIKIKLGRQNFYLYSAVNPKNGESSSLFAPNVNTDCMNIFLEQMSQYLGAREAFLVMDCAIVFSKVNDKGIICFFK